MSSLSRGAEITPEVTDYDLALSTGYDSIKRLYDRFHTEITKGKIHLASGMHFLAKLIIEWFPNQPPVEVPVYSQAPEATLTTEEAIADQLNEERNAPLRQLRQYIRAVRKSESPKLEELTSQDAKLAEEAMSHSTELILKVKNSGKQWKDFNDQDLTLMVEMIQVESLESSRLAIELYNSIRSFEQQFKALDRLITKYSQSQFQHQIGSSRLPDWGWPEEALTGVLPNDLSMPQEHHEALQQMANKLNVNVALNQKEFMLLRQYGSSNKLYQYLNNVGADLPPVESLACYDKLEAKDRSLLTQASPQWLLDALWQDSENRYSTSAQVDTDTVRDLIHQESSFMEGMKLYFTLMHKPPAGLSPSLENAFIQKMKALAVEISSQPSESQESGRTQLLAISFLRKLFPAAAATTPLP